MTLIETVFVADMTSCARGLATGRRRHEHALRSGRLPRRPQSVHLCAEDRRRAGRSRREHGQDVREQYELSGIQGFDGKLRVNLYFAGPSAEVGRGAIQGVEVRFVNDPNGAGNTTVEKA